MNNYRVDRSIDPARAPCGMNSIVYIGDSWQAARAAYDAAMPHIDTWGQRNIAYGVILSVWDQSKNDYIVKCRKGF